VYGAWSTENVTNGVVQEYLEHHRDASNTEKGDMIFGVNPRSTFSPQSPTYELSAHNR